MRKFIWTWVFSDGRSTSLYYWARDWAEANANAANAVATTDFVSSITVEAA